MEIASLAALGMTALTVACRLGPVLALTPLLNSFRIPTTVRMLIVVVLSLVISVSLPRVAQFSSKEVDLVCAELVTGLCLAFSVHAVFAAFSIAGRIVDNQSGLAMGALIDPVSKANGGVLSQIFTVGALAMFFALDGHIAVLRMISVTYEILPLGAMLAPASFHAVAISFSGAFAIGLALVSPIVLALFLVDIVLAITSRSMPQINVLLLATPIKSLIAIALISVTCRYWSSVVGGPESVLNRFLMGV